MTEDERAVIEANEAFYTAFRERDVAAMTALWADRPETACIHPGWDALFGYHAVIESWKGILRNPSAPRVECRDPRAFLLGGVAYVICHEIVRDGVLAATNTFVRAGDAWRLIHHQASPMAVEPKPDTPPPGTTLH